MSTEHQVLDDEPEAPVGQARKRGRAALRPAPEVVPPAAAVEEDEQDLDGDESIDLEQDGGTPPAPPPAPAKDAKGKAPRRTLSPTLEAIRSEEERALKDWLDELGTQGAFKVHVKRIKPENFRDRLTGKETKASGFLGSYDSTIDEEFLQREFGGGTYYLKVTRRTNDGSYRFSPGHHRTVEIAGDPRPESLPGYVAPAQQAAAAGESPALVNAAFSVMQKQIERQNEAGPRGLDPAIKILIDQMHEQNERAAAELRELRKEVAARRDEKPPTDTYKDKLLENMMGGNVAQLQAVEMRHDSDLRQLKESAIENERRLQDRFDRDMQYSRDSHAREVTSMRQSHEISLATAKQSHEIALASAKASFDMQASLLKNDNNRLERDNARLVNEVSDLRAKKDKTIFEQAKEIKLVKEQLFDGEDGAAEKSAFDKIMELASSPAAIEGVQNLLKSRSAAPAPAAEPAAPARPVVMRSSTTGQKFIQRGNQLIPVKKAAKVITPEVKSEDGTVVAAAVLMPQVSEEDITKAVRFMESAFQGGTDPEVFAQTGRTLVPFEILTWIRDNHTDAVNGVDAFMSKVAKLPSTSPLATQGGRNWIRKVGKALVGE